ncbi:MAG: hypothetical protein NTY45_13540 [Elusimicrobia bacterium]|nr:hypothetical protein [Elusimicrobiota bacterium]
MSRPNVRAVTLLLELLNYGDEKVSGTDAMALGRTGGQRALGPLPVNA